jgi:hypothetical protein
VPLLTPLFFDWTISSNNFDLICEISEFEYVNDTERALTELLGKISYSGEQTENTVLKDEDKFYREIAK